MSEKDKALPLIIFEGKELDLVARALEDYITTIEDLKLGQFEDPEAALNDLKILRDMQGQVLAVLITDTPEVADGKA